MERVGRQTPTLAVTLPYEQSKGPEAVELYKGVKRKRECWDWQQLQLEDILAIDDLGRWIHTRYGLAVPRRNGKNEVVIARELWGLTHGEKIMHTAHRTTTSHSAWERLCEALERAGYHYDEHYKSTAQMGLETITMLIPGGGKINFRTRSSKGGLGEGYDLVVIDEAQEYTVDQEAALQYIVTDSQNPQILLTGTPPTTESSGTVFAEYRSDAINGDAEGGWAEWSVKDLQELSDREKLLDLLYETNPSLGLSLTERNVLKESRKDEVDYNIQRLGLWLMYNQKSAITEVEWEALQIESIPPLQKSVYAGVKYGADSTHASLSVAVKTKEGKVFVESIDCKPIRAGNQWIIDFLKALKPAKVVIDGKSGQTLLQEELKICGIKAILPTVQEVISMNSMFEQAVEAGQICHMGQPSLAQAVTNCEHRPIGSGGGFGYRAIKDEVEIGLMDSMILAYWQAEKAREQRKQKIRW